MSWIHDYWVYVITSVHVFVINSKGVTNDHSYSKTSRFLSRASGKISKAYDCFNKKCWPISCPYEDIYMWCTPPNQIPPPPFPRNNGVLTLNVYDICLYEIHPIQLNYYSPGILKFWLSRVIFTFLGVFTDFSVSRPIGRGIKRTWIEPPTWANDWQS